MAAEWQSYILKGDRRSALSWLPYWSSPRRFRGNQQLEQENVIGGMDLHEGWLKAAEETMRMLDVPNFLSLGKGQLQTEVSLEHSHALLFTYCLWLLSCYDTELSKSKTLSTWPYTEKFADSWPLLSFLHLHYFCGRNTIKCCAAAYLFPTLHSEESHW